MSEKPLQKLAIVVTHAIQYYAPIFRLLAARNNIAIKVFHTWSQAQTEVHDRNFGRTIQWDLPLLEGYPYCFSENTAKDPGPHHRYGINNPSLIAEIEAYQPNAVLVFGWSYRSHLQTMRHFFGRIPVLFRGDSHLLNDKPSLKMLARRLVLRWVYRYVDCALFVGSSNRKYFAAHGLTDHQLRFAPHAIDNERFAFAEGADARAKAWRAELGFDEQHCVVLFCGKLEAKKNPQLLLDAFRRAQLRCANLRLLWVGSGSLLEPIRAQIAQCPEMRWLDFQNQTILPSVYRIGDVLCLPSSYDETWGLAVNESFACGRPAIVSDSVGCSEDLIVQGETGWRFPADNLDALTETLIAASQSDLKAIGKTAQQHIQSYSFERICEAIEAVAIGYPRSGS